MLLGSITIVISSANKQPSEYLIDFPFVDFEQAHVGLKIVEIQINENMANDKNFSFKNFHSKYEKTCSGYLYVKSSELWINLKTGWSQLTIAVSKV